MNDIERMRALLAERNHEEHVIRLVDAGGAAIIAVAEAGVRKPEEMLATLMTAVGAIAVYYKFSLSDIVDSLLVIVPELRAGVDEAKGEE